MFLKVLFIEDFEDDTVMILRVLKRIGYEVASERVQTAKAMQAALLNKPWDIIICDYTMPSFNALQALEVLKASGKDLPFIVVSGTIGEETAVTVLKAGAQDFMLKDQLARLGPAIQRELQEAEIRHKRKQAEEKLAASEAELRALFASMTDAVIVYDADGRYVRIAPTNPINLVHSPDEMLGKTVHEILPKEQADYIVAKIREAIQTGRVVPGEYSLQIGGKKIWFACNATRLSENTALWVAHDFTERKQAEEELQKSETRFRTLIEEAPMAILISRNGIIEYVNQKNFQLFGGQNREDMVGRSIIEYLAPKSREESLEHIHRRSLGLPAPSEFEHIGLRADGLQFPIEVVVRNVHLHDGNASISFITDITERKYAEEALLQQAEVMNQVHEAIVVSDLNRLITEWNLGAEMMFGYTAEEMLGKTFTSIYPEDQLSFLVEEIQPQVRKEGWYELETRLRRKSGQVFPAQLMITALKDSQGLVIGFAGSVLDITERKQAEDALRERERQMRALVTSLDDIVFEVDEQGTYRQVWTSNEKLLSMPKSQLVGKNLVDIWGEETGGLLRSAAQRILGSGNPETYEFPYEIHKRTRWSMARVSPILVPGEITKSVAVLVRDITERKAAEAAVHNASLYNRSLIEASLDPLVTIGPDGKITDLNASTETATGFKRNELIGADFSDYFTEPDKARSGYQQVFHEGYVRDYPLELKHRDGHVIPVLYNATLYRDEQGNFIGVFAAIHDITERKEAEQAIHQRFVELATLYASGLALSRLLSPKEIGQKLIELMGSEMNWHHTAIRLYHPEDESLELLAFNLPGTRTTAELREAEQRLTSMISNAGEGLSGWAVQHQQNVRVGELLHDPRFVNVEPNIHSGMYIPLKVEDRVVGVISIESEIPDAFSETDERLTTTLANQAAIALENARLHEETLHQLKQLQALHVIDETIAQSFDQRLMLDVLLTQTLSQLDAEAAAVFRIEFHHQQALEFVAGKGFLTHLIEMASLKLGNSIAGEAVLKRKMVQIREPEEKGPQPLLPKLWSEEGFKSAQAVPLISKGEVKGVMILFHRKDFTPSPGWSSFLETLAGQAAIAMDITQMFDSLQRANLELSLAYEATIEGWSGALDLRDKETEGHSQRVTEMTIQMAKALQLGDEDINHMRRGALLHDIGKLGVPDSILLKVGKLTDEEWLIMRKHPEFAYDMLRPIAYLRDSLDIPYCHHEKWDGTGYPQGLKGEQIPLAARVFAIVDVWDALRSDRPYRQAWSEPDALQYIREQSGKHFDPQVVDVFLKEFENESASAGIAM